MLTIFLIGWRWYREVLLEVLLRYWYSLNSKLATIPLDTAVSCPYAKIRKWDYSCRSMMQMGNTNIMGYIKHRSQYTEKKACSVYIRDWQQVSNDNWYLLPFEWVCMNRYLMCIMIRLGISTVGRISKGIHHCHVK